MSTALVLNGILDVGFLVPAIRTQVTNGWFRALREANGPAKRVHAAMLGWCFALHGVIRLSAGLDDSLGLRRVAMCSYAIEMAAFGSQVLQGNLPFRPVAPTIIIPAIMLLLMAR